MILLKISITYIALQIHRNIFVTIFINIPVQELLVKSKNKLWNLGKNITSTNLEKQI